MEQQQATTLNLRPRKAKTKLEAPYMALDQALEQNGRSPGPVNSTFQQKQRRSLLKQRRLSKEYEMTVKDGESQEVLALLVPSKQRSNRIALSK